MNIKHDKDFEHHWDNYEELQAKRIRLGWADKIHGEELDMLKGCSAKSKLKWFARKKELMRGHMESWMVKRVQQPQDEPDYYDPEEEAPALPVYPGTLKQHMARK